MIQGILFDKDGTLLDFNRTWLDPYLAASETIERFVSRPGLARELMRDGGYIEETRSWATDSLLASGSNEQIIGFWESRAGRSFSVAEVDLIRRHFARENTDYVPAVEGMAELLVNMRSAGIRLGVATMDDRDNADKTLRQMGLDHLFDFVCGADSGFGVKPEPGMVHAFARHCGIASDRVCMVGDSPRDLHMGRNAGVMLSVGVLTGAHARAELEPHGDEVLENILGLPDLLNSRSLWQSQVNTQRT